MAQPRICSLLKVKAPEANRGYLEASGSTVPTNGTDGYQTGCIFKHTDGTAETAIYVNEGSVTSCAFVPLLTTSNEVADLPDIGPLAYTAGKILVADGDSYEEVAVSGDATLASTGALTIATGAVEDSMIEGLSASQFIIGVDGTAANNAKVVMSQDGTLSTAGALTVTALRAGTVSVPALTGNVAISTAALTLAEVDVLDTATMGDAVASKVLGVDANKATRIGAFASGGASTGAVIMAAGLDKYADGQLDIVSVFGASTSDLTGAYSAKCGRFRHLVVTSTGTVAHETYGLVGQLVVKGTTLTHLNSGLLGTFEANTAAVVCNSAYTIGQACSTARLGGHALITATKPVAGFLAFNNGSAALASGVSVAFATSSTSASYPWVLGCYMPVGSVTQAVRIGDFATSAATSTAIPFSTAQDLWTDGQLSTFEVFGSSATDLTSSYSAKCIRGRHVANIGTSGNLAHETYGIMGQLVVKESTLQHLHAGVIGTLEGHTSGVIVNGSYTYGAAAVMARVGGGGAITATKDVAGFAAFLNGAAMASGDCVAFAIGDQGTAPWTHGIGVQRCTNLFDLPAAGTDPVIANALVPAGAPGADTVGADAALRVLVGTVAYYIPLYDTLHA